MKLNQSATLLFLFFELIGDGSAECPTCEDSKVIVDEHNRYRRQLQASNMRKMMYSQWLAALVNDWIKKCNYSHGQLDTSNGKVGQNLLVQVGSKPTSSEVVMKWGSEEPDYLFRPYGTKDCNDGKQCGHYSQMIWATSNKVGCAYFLCETITVDMKTYNNAWLVGCNYFPGGNVNDQLPYVKGERGSNCGQDFNQVKEGLCSNNEIENASCTGRNGSECESLPPEPPTTPMAAERGRSSTLLLFALMFLVLFI